MRILKKTVECGEMKFDIAIDRNIAVEIIEEYPKIFEVLSKLDTKSMKKGESFNALISEAAKNKMLKDLLSLDDLQLEMAAYALPQMLEKAGHTDADEYADKVLKYICDNEADTLFAAGVFDFIMEAFSQSERERKPKVSFAMK